MGRFKLCFIFDETGDYKPVPYAKLMDGRERRKEYEDRYFIPLNGYLLEVSREDYFGHYKTVNHQEYIRKEAKRVEEISYEAMYDEVIEELYEDVAEQVIADMMKANLHKTIAMLDDDDQRLIRMLYFEMQTEQHCAEVFGIDQSTVNRRKKRALTKLKEILLFNA